MEIVVEFSFSYEENYCLLERKWEIPVTIWI